MAYVKCLRGIKGSEIPEGSTATPTDVVETLLNCAGIFDKEYTTIAQLLADTTSLNTVITSNNAIDYLVRSTTFASAVTADQTAMSYIGLNNYASNTLLADSTWCSAICNSTYFESVLNVKVPTMTSNTTPSGVCFASSENSGNEAYKGFDKNNSTYFATASNISSGAFLGYGFTESKHIYCCSILPFNNSRDKVVNVEKSSDNITYNAVISNQTIYWNGIEQKIIFDDSARYWRLYEVSSADVDRFAIYELQFYGRADV